MKIKITNSFIPAGYQNGDIFEVKEVKKFGFIVEVENGFERFITDTECEILEEEK